jgi:maltose/moltooligosaccharide transporter
MTKPRLRLFQIWNMCFGFLGIQIAFGLQNANTSRIFQTLGADIGQLPILWIAAPATGLLVQPIIGYLSDRTWGRLGRRRPYFFFGAILTTAALFVMPNSPALWVAASMLWIMDASINVTMEPFRAFVGDSLPDEQRTTGFAMQSFFIGVGAVFASALPWMLSNWAGVSNEAANGAMPDSVRIAFYLGGACLLAAVWWTVFTTKEYSPAELDAMERARTERIEAPAPPAKGFIAGGVLWLAAGAAAIAAIATFGLQKELYVLAVFITGYGAAQVATGWIRQAGATPGGLLEIVVDLKTMPATMKQLAVVQFFSWFGLFAMWIYTTAAVTARHYGTTDATSPAFNEGADWVGILFATYNGVAAIAALLIPWFARAIGRRATHAAALVWGAGGFAAFFVIHDPRLLLLPMIGVGFAWASILSTPYAILAGALPARKMGVYMGVFNLFIVIPQLLAATVLGWLITTFFNGQAIWALGLGACSFLLAAAAVFAVQEPQNTGELLATSSGAG